MYKKYLFLLLIAIGFSAKAYDDCCCGPLPGRFSATVYAGVDPALFADRGNSFVVIPTAPDTDPFIEVTQNRKFNEIFKNPGLSVGVNLGYNICPCVELFGEFQYARHNGRDKPLDITINIPDTPVDAQLTTDLDNFSAYSGYVGGRYFFNRIWCDRLAFFFGSKVGIRHYDDVKANPLTLTATEPEVNFSQCVTWFNSANTVGGGIQVGCDVIVCNCYSFFFNAEVVASCPLNTNTIITSNVPTQSAGITNLVGLHDGVLVSFPVNFGLRYYFG